MGSKVRGRRRMRGGQRLIGKPVILAYSLLRVHSKRRRLQYRSMQGDVLSAVSL